MADQDHARLLMLDEMWDYDDEYRSII